MLYTRLAVFPALLIIGMCSGASERDTTAASLLSQSSSASVELGLLRETTFVAPTPSSVAQLPALPQATVDVRWVAPTGQTRFVPAGGDLQAALNAAQPGDEVVLQAGATYTGNFTLPAKSGTGWILVRSNGTLPAQGERLTPSRASGVARVVTPNASAAIQTAAGTRGWRLVGLEITVAPSVGTMTHIVGLGDGSQAQNSLAKIPQALILDRVWVHGHATLNVRRCVSLQSATTAIINSTISECHDKGFDSQAVWGWNGPGPFLIENNYLEGSSENVGFGGAVPGISGLIPSDIVIRGNHIAKPAAWKTAGWMVKNLIEFKNARRVLIEGNLVEGNWQAAQPGYALVLTPGYEDGGCGWCTVQDITFRYNHVRRTGSVLNLAANPHGGTLSPAARIRFEHNLFDEINVAPYTAQGRLFLLQNAGLADVAFVHNTALGTDIAILFAETGMQRIEFTDNILYSAQGYGLWSASGLPGGTAAISGHVQNWAFARNVAIKFPASNHPSGNWYPTSLTEVGFANPNQGDWRLLLGSRYARRAFGGRNPGADIMAIRCFTESTVDGQIVPGGSPGASSALSRQSRRPIAARSATSRSLATIARR